MHPITILSRLPSAGFGALLSLYLFHLAATRGWVSPLLDDEFRSLWVCWSYHVDWHCQEARYHDDRLRAGGAEDTEESPMDAIYEGCLVRFRPIMMTTMALMGTLPIVLGFGPGAEFRRALGVSVVGGLFFSQIVTLFLTPVVYLYLEKARLWSVHAFRRTHSGGGLQPDVFTILK